MVFEQLIKLLDKDEENKEIEIISTDNGQTEISLESKNLNKNIDKLKVFSENSPKETKLLDAPESVEISSMSHDDTATVADSNELTEGLVIETHNFENAKRRLKEFLEKKQEDFKIDTVKASGDFLFWKVGNHKVTGDEFNSRLVSIQQHLINLNTKIYESNKEFGEVYNAIEALDKDYIAVILTSINATEEVSKHTKEEIDTIKEVQKKILEKFQKLKQELKINIDEISNESQIRYKEVSSLSKELKKTQIISFVSIATTLILGILIVSKVL